MQTPTGDESLLVDQATRGVHAAPGALVRVLVVGRSAQDLCQQLELRDTPDGWATGFDCVGIQDDSDLFRTLSTFRPQVIVSFGDVERHRELDAAPLDIRQRWLHFDEGASSPGEIAAAVMACFVENATRDRFPDEPLVSVVTPTFCTGERILRLYGSLEAQSYDNWEWVVYDDSPDDGTFDLVREIRERDPRVVLFRADEPCGIIGEVKRRCCGLARGAVLAEVDHDDELTADALRSVVEAFARFPEAGFAYTDCAEVLEDGRDASYGDGFAFGFGSYRNETYRGRDYLVTNYPSVNAKTVRHIVGMPNHLRAWRRDAYHQAGGHSALVHVADDYELCLRTFLTTRMVHIQRFGYIQYLGVADENTQRRRNPEIQRLVAHFAHRYGDEIHRRFLELGVDDFIWTPDGCDWTVENPDPVPVANLVLS